MVHVTLFSMIKGLYFLHSYFPKYVVIITISFMQGIYNYVPETNHVSREYSVATIL